MNISFKNIQSNHKTGEKYFTAGGNEKTIYHGWSVNYPHLCPVSFDVIKVRPVNKDDMAFLGEKAEGVTSVTEVKNIVATGYDKETSSKFLLTSYFKNCLDRDAREGTISKLMEEFGHSIFDEDGLLSSDNEKYANIISKLKNIKTLETLYGYMTGFGGDLGVSTELYSRFGERALETVKANPYICMRCGGSIDICDRIAQSVGVSYSDPERLSSIISSIMWHNEIGCGNTRISFTELCKKFHALEKRTGRYNTNPFYIASSLLDGEYRIQSAGDDENYIWREKTYLQEKSLESNLLRIKNTAVPLEHEMLSIEEVEVILDIKYRAEQRNAFKCLDTSGVKVITGGPGVGKTTLLDGLLYYYEMQNPAKKNILLCSPTGCAAMRMEKSTGRSASTLHSALGIKPYTDNELINASLDADLIVADEFSMADTYIAACLFKSVKNGATVILMGDADQLPSVGAGNVFKDIIDSGMFEVYRLTEIMRQKGDSAIIENSRKILAGDETLINDSSFQVKVFNSEAEMLPAVRSAAKQGYLDGNFRVFSPVRKPAYDLGTTNLNVYLHSEFKDGREILYNGYRFSEGDRVMFTENNKDLEVVNGQEGIIKSIQTVEGNDIVTVESEGKLISLIGQNICQLELSYAVTAHKSQGSEIDNALIVIPENPSNMLRKQLLYVEVTRAKKRADVYCTKKSLETILKSRLEITRNTGLLKDMKTYRT